MSGHSVLVKLIHKINYNTHFVHRLKPPLEFSFPYFTQENHCLMKPYEDFIMSQLQWYKMDISGTWERFLTIEEAMLCSSDRVRWDETQTLPQTTVVTDGLTGGPVSYSLPQIFKYLLFKVHGMSNTLGSCFLQSTLLKVKLKAWCNLSQKYHEFIFLSKRFKDSQRDYISASKLQWKSVVCDTKPHVLSTMSKKE